MGPLWIGHVGRGKSSVGEFVSSNNQTQPRGPRLSPFYLFIYFCYLKTLGRSSKDIQIKQSPQAPSLGQVSDPSAMAAQMPSVADSWAQTWFQPFL